MEELPDKPFQSLQLLVRDWNFPNDHGYGSGGGMEHLTKRLEKRDNQHEELQTVRTHIEACFSETSCFLMPHPGREVATSPTFKGCLKDIDEDFKKHLDVMVCSLLSPENLIVKKINGRKVTCRGLLEYFKAYGKIYQGDTLPVPKTRFQATVETNNLTALSQAKDLYIRSMEKVCGGDMPYMKPGLLEDCHNGHRKKAVDKFTATRKMGGKELSASYLDNLKNDVDEAYESYKKANASKHILL